MATQERASAVDPAIIARFDLKREQVIQEFGYDTDVDEPLRAAIADATGESLVDEEFGDVTDGAIVWFRDGDDDLADLLMDVQGLMDEGGTVWLLTPKAGRPGQVAPRDMEEASSLAGLHAMSTFVACSGWSATELGEKGRSK